MVIREESGKIAATSMATHDHTWLKPFCGEVGWTAGDPAHAGKGSGETAVSAVLTGLQRERLLDVFYNFIPHLEGI